MSKLVKGLTKSFKENFANIIPEDKECSSLAAKYNVPFTNGKADAGCPGIMNPLNETPAIEFQWGSGFHNEDKTNRFNQFHKALVTMTTFDEGNLSLFLNKYLELNIHGRVMFFHIADINSKGVAIAHINDHAEKGLKGLNINVVPYGKGGATIEQIFNHYIPPITLKYTTAEHNAKEAEKVEVPVTLQTEHKEADNKDGKLPSTTSEVSSSSHTSSSSSIKDTTINAPVTTHENTDQWMKDLAKDLVSGNKSAKDVSLSGKDYLEFKGFVTGQYTYQGHLPQPIANILEEIPHQEVVMGDINIPTEQ